MVHDEESFAVDEEIEAIVAISKVLSKIVDQAMRKRILSWACEKYAEMPAAVTPTARLGTAAPSAATISPLPEATSKEIPGVAILEDDGKIQFTIRDPKAKSAADAGIRSTLVAILVHERLTGKPEASSKNLVVPLLRDWRIYDGNIRQALADHKGIIRAGDSMRLDSYAKAEAESILQQIQDPEIQGKWNPNQVGKKGKKTKKNGPTKSLVKDENSA